MSKLKVKCFYYKDYTDIYVSNVYLSVDKILSILDIFQNQQVIVLIESDENYTSSLSMMGKSLGMRMILHSHKSRLIIACSIMDLFCLLRKVTVNAIEGMFIANINADSISDERMNSLEEKASRVVKDKISGMSLSINFPENEMIVSLVGSKNEVASMKDEIYRIWNEQT